MATMRVFRTFNMDRFSIDRLVNSGVTSGVTSSHVRIEAGPEAVAFRGTGLEYTAAGQIIAGTMHSGVFTKEIGGAEVPIFRVDGLDKSAARLWSLSASKNEKALFTFMLSDGDRITAVGGDGNLVRGYAGNDTMTGSNAGADRLFGGTGGDTISGRNGNDRLTGEAGNDRLFGGAGADTLTGGAGSDRLTGGADADILFGGASADTFLFTLVSDSTPASADLIGDFEKGIAPVDRIDVSAIDANANTAGDDAFSFIGSAAFTSTAGELRWSFNIATQQLLLEGDTNGDAVADLAVILQGVAALDATDVIA